MKTIDCADDDKIIHGPKSEYTADPRGLGYVLFTSMEKYKENVAQIDGVTGEKDTYASLLQRCVQTAIKMRSMGVTPNDIVSTCTFNHLNSCVPYLATLFLGAKISNFDPTLSLQDTVHLMRQVPPKIIFVAPEAVELIENAVKEASKSTIIVEFGPTEKHVPFSEFLQPNPKEESTFRPHEVADLKETALIFFTSGTTGLPKGICINHYSYMHQQMNAIQTGFTSDVILGFSSLYWITPSVCLCIAIFIGSTRLLLPKFDAHQVWKTIDQFKPSLVFAVPFHFCRLVETKPPNVDVSSVEVVGIGGGAILEKQVMEIRKMFPRAMVSSGYGQTEMAMMITSFKPNHVDTPRFLLEKPTSSGTAVPGISYKVVDADTEESLGPNKVGELRLKTDYCFNGYYNMDASDSWDKNGWFRTGDLVYYDEDECFFVVDRLKEFLKFQSWHVPPSLLENILMTHPDVANTVVFGQPHDVDENHLTALVVLKENHNKVTPKDIEKYVEERVDDRKRLRGGVKIVDIIPLTETGKIQRRKIRDMFLRGEI